MEAILDLLTLKYKVLRNTFVPVDLLRCTWPQASTG
jgi:hypothetical protein